MSARGYSGRVGNGTEVSNMGKPSAFYFSMQLVLKEYGKWGINVSFSGTMELCHQWSSYTARQAYPLTLQFRSQFCLSSKDSDFVYSNSISFRPVDAKRKNGLMGHLARWSVATSNLLPELFPETSSICASLLPHGLMLGSLL